jgi:hypothetical protein
MTDRNQKLASLKEDLSKETATSYRAALFASIFFSVMLVNFSDDFWQALCVVFFVLAAILAHTGLLKEKYIKPVLEALSDMEEESKN